MALLLGVDLGTSYLKAALFDLSGELRGLGRVAVAIQEPEPGRRELPVETFLERLREAVAMALQTAGAGGREVAAISYASQANTFLLLDEMDRPLTPLIFWHDRRADVLEPELEKFGASAEHQARTGLTQILPGRAPVKARWLARNAPEVWRRGGAIMTVSDYFTFFLTGKKVGDASTAALTGLYDLVGRGWWTDALAAFDLAEAQLSTPLLPGTKAGRLTPEAAGFFNLPRDLPVFVGALDHHAAAIGSGVGTQVDAALSSGTVLAALVLAKEATAMSACLHGPGVDGKSFFRLAFDSSGAGRLEDYQRSTAPDLPLGHLLDALDRESPGVLSSHSRMLRQHLREMAESERTLLERISLGRKISRIAATGGGARSRVAREIKADVFQAEIVSASPEAACLGAAVLAAVGADFFPSVSEASNELVRTRDKILPRKTAER